MKLLIHGPKAFNDYNFMVDRLLEFFSSFKDYTNLEIVAANTEGFCKMVKKYANNRGIKFTEHVVDFENFGRQANYICNKIMADYCKGEHNHCIVFWDSKSLILKNLLKETIKTKMSVLKIPVRNQTK